MLGRVTDREDIRTTLAATYPGSPAADFVADVLMAGPEPFFPAVALPDGGTGQFLAIARLAALEIRITEATLRRAGDGAEALRAEAVRRLWTRLCRLRARAAVMAHDYALLGADRARALVRPRTLPALPPPPAPAIALPRRATPRRAALRVPGPHGIRLPARLALRVREPAGWLRIGVS